MNQLIYVVDDQVDYLSLVRHVFANHLSRYSVVFFAGGEAMLNHLQTSAEHPALILIDLYMPNLNGQQTLEQLKKNADWKPIPVVIVTSATSSPEIQVCYTLGANSCLEKPRGVAAIQKFYDEVCTYWTAINRPATE